MEHMNRQGYSEGIPIMFMNRQHLKRTCHNIL